MTERMRQMIDEDPRFSLATLQYFAPNFRCTTYGDGCYVEIPDGWQRRYDWDHDPATADAIRSLIRAHGKRARAFEGAATGIEPNGYLVPVAEWDRVMNQPVGVQWDKAQISDDDAMALLRSASD